MSQIAVNPRSENLLAHETSPYLLQHASNPVHWRPWGPAALEEARKRNCPILLSIGYAACHWCHVMAHESFEDEEVAKLMNRLYVNVKVDREERPDIDQIYMAALSAMNEQGGWPLTMFLTPDGKPFWGGTYFPKLPRYDRAGFVQILQAISNAWAEKREEIEGSAGSLTAHIDSRLARSASDPTNDDFLPRLAGALLPMIDRQRGGLKGAPKFPNAPFLTTLWLQWLNVGDTDCREAVLISLRKMLAGGIYDHVGGGLARYSTDDEWLIPHFEKMLYDNALLLRLCNWVYAHSAEQLFRKRIEQTVDWLLREMQTDAGFASSLDADSEGEEGVFYTWSNAQLRDALGNQLPNLSTFYSQGTQPQWEGDPVLFQTPDQIIASERGPEADAAIRSLLLADREKRRTRPSRDDKVLTDWNGMAIQALAETGKSLQQPKWIECAAVAFERITMSADEGGRLPHAARADRRLYPAFSSDYAAMINASVSLYEATGTTTYLDHGRSFLKLLDIWHGDDTGLGHYFTASDSADVPIRIRGDVDDATPSANAQVIEAIARLASATGEAALALRAQEISRHAQARIRDQQFGQAGIINASAIARQSIKLVLVDDAKERLVAVANRIPDPRRVDIVHRMGEAGAVPELTEGVYPTTERPGAWLCTNQTCLPVITDENELARALTARAG
ncbi:MAG: thioredoxin domain-containing protein [Rhizobiaceae bacterium]|nr:thioredoxin domain-containing protein [Rhizobiaceae bacterium]